MRNSFANSATGLVFWRASSTARRRNSGGWGAGTATSFPVAAATSGRVSGPRGEAQMVLALPAPVGGDTGPDDHGLGDHSPVDSGLAVGGVQEDVGEGLVGQAAFDERADFGVDVCADPRH